MPNLQWSITTVRIEANELCQDQENGEKCVACRKTTDLGHLILQLIKKRILL